MDTESGPAQITAGAEGERLAREAMGRALPLRLFGGVAVWVRCPSARALLQREYGDLDFVTLGHATRQASDFLEEHGYAPDRLFNALHGADRMTFAHAESGRKVDVIVNRFVMCHEIDLRHRLPADEPTIPLVDLLATKLQVVQINRKDLLDITALLADHDLGTGLEAIETARLLALTADDWGLEHTITINLRRLPGGIGDFGLPEAQAALVARRASAILDLLAGARKGPRWRLRAAIGEHVRWYQLPEEAQRQP